MRGQKWDGKNYGGWATYPWSYPGPFSQQPEITEVSKKIFGGKGPKKKTLFWREKKKLKWRKMGIGD